MITTKTIGQTSKASAFKEKQPSCWRGKEYVYAHALLKEKYPEYQTEEGGWKEGDIPIIKVMPTSFTKWSQGEWKK